MPPVSAPSPSGARRTTCWARRWGGGGVWNVQWGMKAWSGNRRRGDLPMCFPPEDLLTKYDNIDLEGSYLTSLATLQGEGHEGFMINSFTTGLYCWGNRGTCVVLHYAWMKTSPMILLPLALMTHPPCTQDHHRVSTSFPHTCYPSVWLCRPGNTQSSLIRQPAGLGNKPQSQALKLNDLPLEKGWLTDVGHNLWGHVKWAQQGAHNPK